MNKDFAPKSYVRAIRGSLSRSKLSAILRIASSSIYNYEYFRTQPAYSIARKYVQYARDNGILKPNKAEYTIDDLLSEAENNK